MGRHNPGPLQPNPWQRRWEARRGLLLAVLVLALSGEALRRHARAQGRPQPQPPPSRPSLYDPDPTTCQPEAIRSGFARQLEPYADQSEPVLQRLRQVQAQLTVASLRRCVAKGLMAEPAARALAAELLEPRPQTSPPSTRP